jgi:WD40 repeat protein
MLAASSSDGSLFVWEDWRNPEKAASPIKLRHARGVAFQIAFSGDGDYLVGSSDDGVVRMWATQSDKTISQWEQIGQLRGHKGPVWAVAVSPKGDHIASGSTDGSIISWNRHSAFEPNNAPKAPSGTDVRNDSAPSTLGSCIEDLKLSKVVAAPVACLTSPHGRTIVALSDGRLEVFDPDPNVSGAVDTYRVGADVVGLTLEGNRLVVRRRSGSDTEWPFFDSLDELIAYSLDHLPFAGTAPLKLPHEVRCRISDKTENCEAEP